ncbi:MAG TPA: phosphatase PAP2 family protein [Chthoniobacterales bacterium]|jgi:undecaprenyl-diphosphatase
MKDKRNRLVRWLLFLAGAGIVIWVSFVLDDAARGWMTGHQSMAMRSFMRGVSRYGDWPEHVALGLILTAMAWSRGAKTWMRVFAAMILACALAGIGARAVKVATGRARPNVQTEARWNGPRLSSRYNAFPSGHTAASTAFFATLILAGWRIGAGLLLLPVLIAFSRMYGAAHYLSDVVCGALIGLLAAFLVVRWKPLRLADLKSEIQN